MFHTFVQNFDGRHKIINDDISIFTVIEGENLEDIINLAQNLGIYFDGVKNFQDCSCCGDRWERPKQEELTNLAEIEGQLLSEFYDPTFDSGYSDKHDIVVHYMDGHRRKMRFQNGFATTI